MNCPLYVDDGGGYVQVDDQSYLVDEASWAIEEYPTGRARQAEAGFEVQTVSYGLAELTVDGESRDEGTEATFTVTCDFGLDGFMARLTADGGFEFVENPDLEPPGCALRSD